MLTRKLTVIVFESFPQFIEVKQLTEIRLFAFISFFGQNPADSAALSLAGFESILLFSNYFSTSSAIAVIAVTPVSIVGA
jgi:hypothetical protein